MHLVEFDVAADPVAIGAFGKNGVVPQPHDFTDPVQEFAFGIGAEAFAGF